MATYSGSDKRLAYLFQNGGGGGASALNDLSDVAISTPTDGQALLYDANNQEWVNGTVQGGGGAVNDGTVGVRIDKLFSAGESKTYTYDELGITEKGYYIFAIASNHAEPYQGWKWYGYLCYSGNNTNNYSYVKAIDSNNMSVTMDSVNKTITIQNTNGNWAETFRIEVLPLHPKIEVEKHTYSTTEQVVGTWIDGKPIYEITIPTGSLPNNSAISLTTPSNIGYVIEYSGFVYNTSDSTHQRPLPLSAGGSSDIRLDLNSGTLRITTYSNWNNYEGYVTVKYTKSTD